MLCKLGIHKYLYFDNDSPRCDNCEHIGMICFYGDIRLYKCKNCEKLKIKNNICEICHHVQSIKI